ncbi:hypothetical protein LPJ53_001959 [Coemansia erecta]|uniref:RZZ complex subunit KNTC1/ROD C-terminal domain-containing protein n=1 Tax=Coemansia erecta TaxID=147472 RepID=A0A9W7XZ33_9FUNG|nr:hypothetical protein LPJ53_001959 [Coemansia erecta]
MTEDSDGAQPKRRRVSAAPASPSKAPEAAEAEEWRVEVRGAADETLQLGRVDRGAGERTLDAYKLETLLSGHQPPGAADGPVGLALGGEHVAVAVGRAIHVADASGSHVLAVVRHESHVTCAALNADGQFVAFGDGRGALFIVHVATRRVVFTRALPGGAGVRRVVFGREDGGGEALVVVAGRHVERFGGIRARELGRAIAAGEAGEAARLGGLIGVAAADPAHVPHGEVADVAAAGCTLVAGRGDDEGEEEGAAALSSWQVGAGGALRLADAVGLAGGGGGYVRVEASHDGRHAVALGPAGRLDVYERRTLTRVFRFGAGVADFALLPAPGAGLRAAVVVSADGDGDGASDELLVVDLPGGRARHALDVARGTRLARGRAAQHDASVVFVERRAGGFDVRRLAEAQPVERLAHFVRLGRFAAADAFALAHGIAPAHVARARLEAMAAGAAGQACDGADDDEALRLVRLAAGPPAQLADVALRLPARTLRGAQALVREAQAAARASGDAALVGRAGDAARRLGTWLSVAGAFDAAAWQAFRSADLAAHVRAWLAQGDVARAAAVWRRHAGDARVRGDLAAALHAFPVRGDAGALARWLGGEARRVAGGLAPGVRGAVGAWLEARARVLEALPGRLADALVLAEAAVAVAVAGSEQALAAAFLRAQLADLALLQREHALALPLDAYAQLAFSDVACMLLDRVAAAERLGAAYRAHFVPYARAHRLDHVRLAQQYCERAMRPGGAWEPRVAQLLRCLQAEAEAECAACAAGSRSPALRAYAGVALAAMRRAEVPWSAAVDAAMAGAVAVLQAHAGPADADAEAAQWRVEAAEHVRLMRLRRMLVARGLADFRVSNTRMAQPLVLRLVRARAGDASAAVLRDALLVADAYHHVGRVGVYVARVQALCAAGRAEDAGDVVRLADELEASEPAGAGAGAGRPAERLAAREVGRRALCWAREALDAMPFAATPASRQAFRAHAAAACAVVRGLRLLADRYAAAPAGARRPAVSPAELARLQALVAREAGDFALVWQLLADAGLMVSPGELRVAATRAQILDDMVDRQWLRPLDPRRALPPLLPPRIAALAAMLHVPRVELLRRVAVRCADLRLPAWALDACGQLVRAAAAAEARREGVAPWADVLRALAAAERLVARAPEGAHVRRMLELAQTALRTCAAAAVATAPGVAGLQDVLAALVDMQACWDLAVGVFGQTTEGDFARLTQRRAEPEVEAGSSASSGLPDGQWLAPLFAGTYAERGLVLPAARVMPLVGRLASALRRLPSPAAAELLQRTSDQAPAAAQPRREGKMADTACNQDQDHDLDPDPDRDLDMDRCDSDSDYDCLDLPALRAAAIARCRALVGELAQGRHWMLAVQTLQLTVAQLARSAFATGLADDPADAASDDTALDLLRQRLAGGGLSDDELHVLLAPLPDTDLVPDVAALAGRSLVRALQQTRGLDAPFVFATMLMTPVAQAYHRLSGAMSHAGLLPARVVELANIGAACSSVWQQQALLDRCRSVAAAARWGEQLQLLRLAPPFDITSLNAPTRDLLMPLVRPMLLRTGMDISAVLEFADAFRLDDSEVVLEYISLCCSAPGVSAYQARVLAAVDEVANSKLLERTYVDCLENAVSAYDYERLLFVVEQLQALRPQDATLGKYQAVLHVLSSHERRAPPPHEELLVEWARTAGARRQRSLEQQLPPALAGADAEAGPPLDELLKEYPLAPARLPFHSLVNATPWATLLPELSAESVDALLPLAAPLGLSEDDFYINLIDAMLKQWNAAPTAQVLSPTEPPARFNAVKPLIQRLKDPEATISTIKHVADELPCGPDRIAALKTGMKLVSKWGQSIKRLAEPDMPQMLAKAEAIYVLFEKSLTDSTVEITLRRNALEQHLPLFVDAQDADAVVRALAAVFETACDRSSQSSQPESGIHVPKAAEQNKDINNAAIAIDDETEIQNILEALAKVYAISLESLMRKLLDKYLATPVSFVSASSDLLLPSTRCQLSLRRPDSQESVLRRRVTCILRIYPPSDAVRALLGFAYDSRSGSSCLCRARALDILFSLASDDDIAQLQEPEDVHAYLQALVYLADFDYVGIPQSNSDFISCDKPALARSVWVDCYEDPKAVQLVCNMCLDFAVDDCNLMVQLLRRLHSAGLFHYVAGVLSTVSSTECYSTEATELAKFWNQTLVGYVTQAVSQISDSRGGADKECDTIIIETLLEVFGLCLHSVYLFEIDVSAVVGAALALHADISRDELDIEAADLIACAAFDILPHSQSAEDALLERLSSLDPHDVHRLIIRLLDFAEHAARLASPVIFVDWATSRSMTLVFDMVDNAGTHEQVLLNPPLGRAVHAFVRNRIAQDKLQVAVQACLAKDKHQLASQLVCRYYQTRSTDVLVDDAKRAGFNVSEAKRSSSAGSDNTIGTSDFDMFADTQDMSAEERKLIKGLTDQNKLEIYMHSRN